MLSIQARQDFLRIPKLDRLTFGFIQKSAFACNWAVAHSHCPRSLTLSSQGHALMRGKQWKSISFFYNNFFFCSRLSAISANHQSKGTYLVLHRTTAHYTKQSPKASSPALVRYNRRNLTSVSKPPKCLSGFLRESPQAEHCRT